MIIQSTISSSIEILFIHFLLQKKELIYKRGLLWAIIYQFQIVREQHIQQFGKKCLIIIPVQVLHCIQRYHQLNLYQRQSMSTLHLEIQVFRRLNQANTKDHRTYLLIKQSLRRVYYVKREKMEESFWIKL